MSDEIKRITRDMFIDQDKALKSAFSKGTWFVIDGEDIIEKPMPKCIIARGKMPIGYALGESSYYQFRFLCSYHNDRD